MSLINLPSMPQEIKSFASNPGNEKRPAYKYVYDEKYGCPRRVKNGEINLQDLIQQSADDIDFKAIGKMLVDTRDNVISHFTQDGDRVIDTTLMPRNIHEYEALHNKMKASFDSLPDEIKSLFGNSFETFAGAYKAGTLQATFDTYSKGQKEGVVPPTEDEKGDK